LVRVVTAHDLLNMPAALVGRIAEDLRARRHLHAA
jgi:hypothetical protein